ncbi:hypothetical protein ACUOA5_50100, partial [Escherichia coli]
CASLDLYQMRVNKPKEQTEPYTTKEIETYFGMIADDTDDIFTDKEKHAYFNCHVFQLLSKRKRETLVSLSLIQLSYILHATF